MSLLASFSSLMKKWIRWSESIGTFKWIRWFSTRAFFGNIFKRRNVTSVQHFTASDYRVRGNRHRIIISKGTISAGTWLFREYITCQVDVQPETALRYFQLMFSRRSPEFMFTTVVGQSPNIYGIEKSRSLSYSTTGRYSKESTHADYKVYGQAITLLLLRYEALPESQR